MVIIVDAVTDILLRILQRDGAVPRQETVKAHREIVRCLRRRDAERAILLMRRHFKALHAYLFEAEARGATATKPRKAVAAAR